MNTLSENVINCLIVINSADYLQQLYKLCLEKVKDGCLVVLITSGHYEFSKLIAELLISKDQLKNFIIMYYETIDDISRKLLLQHSWSLLPTVVAVDLTQLLSNEQQNCSTSGLLMQKVAFCTVSLLAYLESIAHKLPRIANAGNLTNTVYGFLILPTAGEQFGDIQIQTLKDLYFYKTDLYRNFEAVRTLMQKAGQL